MKKLGIAAAILFIGGCKTTPEPTGQWLWEDPVLYDRLDRGEITPEEVNQTFLITKSKCKIEALKVPLPPPSCVQQAAPSSCASSGALVKGFCQGFYSQPRCDYTAYNAAKQAQSEIFENCLQVAGWVKFWKPFSDNETEPANTASSDGDEEDIELIVKSIPELYRWYEEDGERWKQAQEVDNELISDPNYKNLPTRKRLLFVVEQVKSKSSQTQANSPNQISARGNYTDNNYVGTGLEHWIKENNSFGKLIILEDGSIWKIMDNIDTMLWLPLDRIAVLQTSQSDVYRLINKNDGTDIFAQFLGKQ